MTRRQFSGVLACAVCAAAGMLTGCGSGSGGGIDGATPDNPSATVAGEVPSAASRYEQISDTVFAFDTVVELSACCAEETMRAAVERCEYFESIFSRTIETSDIGRINVARGKPVEVAPETADIIIRALEYCKASGGKFDITIGAVSSLWDFKEGVVPDDKDIREAIRHIDYSGVHVEGTTVTLDDPDAKIDLGGIAKGYIADDLARLFLDAGCDSACINLGGNVKTVGLKPDGSVWRVGIQDPNNAQGQVVAAVDSQDRSVVTSGLYERQFTKGGKRYWHILDPKTGYPVRTDLVSATIISSASVDGDGYTKPLFMMGRDAALAWIDSHEGIEGMVVGQDGTIMQSVHCDAKLV